MSLEANYIFFYEVIAEESTSGRAKRARWLFSGLVVDPSSRLIPDQSTSHLFISFSLSLPVACRPSSSVPHSRASLPAITWIVTHSHTETAVSDCIAQALLSLTLSPFHGDCVCWFTAASGIYFGLEDTDDAGESE